MLGIPDVHDYYAINADLRGDWLVIRVQWMEYSIDHSTPIVSYARELCFMEVRDIDASPAANVRIRSTRGCIPALVDILSGHEYKEARTTRELLMQALRHATPHGEPLDRIEAVPNGFLLITHLSGAYFISASAVDWCGSPA